MIVSCIIPTYQQINYLYETLDSVFAQNYESIELIITDDATDNFPKDEVEKYINNNKHGNIIRYVILTHKHNVGTVKNMNSAIKECKGELIIPLASDDCFYDENVINRVVNLFITKKFDVLSCSRMKYSVDLKEPIRLIPHPAYSGLLDRYMNMANKQYTSMALGSTFEFASGSALYYSAAFIKEYGGYDEKYVLWEDGPFLARTAREGIKIDSAFDIIAIKYRVGGISSNKKNTPNLIYRDYCNMIKWEYLEYKENFTARQNRIIQGRYALQENYNQISVSAIIKYPEAVLNHLFVKVQKGIFRGIYSMKKRLKYNETSIS
jgi:glycosyltransferase involved in cell wall biosynthesis